MNINYKACLVEMAAILSFMLFWQYFAGIAASLSVLYGSGTWILPQIYFIWRSRATLCPRSSSGQMLGSFFANEAIKLILSAILVILCVKLLKIMLLPFINGYIIAVFMGLFLSYQLNKH